MDLKTFLRIYTTFISEAGAVDTSLRLLSGLSSLYNTRLDAKNEVSGQLLRFNQQVADTRAMMRLFGAPKQLSLFLNNSDKDPVFKFLHLAQNISIGMFYPPDHIAFLGNKGINFKGYDFGYYARLGSQLWALWLVFGIVEGFYSLQKVAQDLDSTSAKEDRRRLHKERTNVYIGLVGNFADLAIALAGSIKTEKPVFSPLTGSILTLIASIVSIRKGWLLASKKVKDMQMKA